MLDDKDDDLVFTSTYAKADPNNRVAAPLQETIEGSNDWSR